MTVLESATDGASKGMPGGEVAWTRWRCLAVDQVHAALTDPLQRGPPEMLADLAGPDSRVPLYQRHRVTQGSAQFRSPRTGRARTDHHHIEVAQVTVGRHNRSPSSLAAPAVILHYAAMPSFTPNG